MTAAPSTADTSPVTTIDDIVAYFESGCKPPENWKVGTEWERFLVDANGNPPEYEGSAGVRAVLEGLRQYGWGPILENGNPIALQRDGTFISLEPGGQIEISGKPQASLQDMVAEFQTFDRELEAVCRHLGLSTLAVGFHPTWTREQMPMMPKGRYGIMWDYMAKTGQLGRDMMKRTCTAQANLDYGSEEDMVRMFRLSLAIQPIVTALFANSPLCEGRDTGQASHRMHIWSDTDPDRCGIPDFVFGDDFGFRRYAGYAADVPMYFVYRDGQYLDATKTRQTFRDFMNGNLAILPGERPTLADLANHLSTLFPDVRLKKYLEMRGADSGPMEMVLALPALWKGLLYREGSLSVLEALTDGWTAQTVRDLQKAVIRDGLQAEINGCNVHALAQIVVSTAMDALPEDEKGLLTPLQDIALTGRTLADRTRETMSLTV